MKKKTFWKKSASESKSHLRFIISDPDENNMVLVVNMTTYNNTGREDTSCILNIGDHPKVAAKSWIYYAESEELNIIKLLNDKWQNILNFDADITNEVLHKIQTGARQTNRLPKKFKKYFSFF